MDRRSFLMGFTGVIGVTAVAGGALNVAEALPLRTLPELPPLPDLGPAVATEADIEAAKADKAYWVVYRWRRPRRRRRRYYYFYRPRRRFRWVCRSVRTGRIIHYGRC